MQEHEASPDQVSNMRQTALSMINSIRHKIEIHALDKNILTYIENNKDTQVKYSELMKRIKDSNGSFETLDELMSYSVHEQAAWMLFTIRYHEDLWKLKLLNEEERSI